MANTYRSQSRDHRTAIASYQWRQNRVALPLRTSELACEMSASCNLPATIIAIRGVDSFLWPAVCEEHLHHIA